MSSVNRDDEKSHIIRLHDVIYMKNIFTQISYEGEIVDICLKSNNKWIGNLNMLELANASDRFNDIDIHIKIKNADNAFYYINIEHVNSNIPDSLGTIGFTNVCKEWGDAINKALEDTSSKEFKSSLLTDITAKFVYTGRPLKYLINWLESIRNEFELPFNFLFMNSETKETDINVYENMLDYNIKGAYLYYGDIVIVCAPSDRVSINTDKSMVVFQG